MRKMSSLKILEKLLPEESIKDFIKNKETLIDSNKISKARYNIPELVMKYGDGIPKFYKRTFLTMISTIIHAKRSYKDVRKNPKYPKTIASEKFQEELIQYAKDLGVLDLGFAQINPSFIFKNCSILYKNAIVVTIEMDKEAISKAPSKITGHEVHRTYRNLGIIVNKIAEFLRMNGFGAQANPALGGDVNYSLLAEAACLGAIGNHGLLISSHVGARQRIAAIYTSIENLPIKHTNEYLWIKEFCKKCRKCVRTCPSNAIYDGPKNDYSNALKHIDYKKCAVSFSKQCGCSVCIKECTFNNEEYEKIKKGFNRIKNH